ncbi:hypothetical protein F5884DRAFT_84276 [Xylogone sp. PMI_703]|nr:hypothetical protein F5884DRAFT_84276 [Xylogone sp. PMI_703]
MPPDIIRPYITMSICDLIIIARLLQMKWTLFDPQKGALRAEGHDCLMESRVLPSVGTMIDFKPIRSKLSADGSSVTERWYIPKPESYRMIFGIIPADPGLTTFAESGFRVSAERGDITEWHRTLSEILRACGVDSFVGDIDYLAADLLPLVAPMLRNLHSPIIKLPQPYHNKDSWIGLRRAFNAFPVELERLIEKQDALGSSTGDIVMNTPLLLKEILEAAQEMRKEPHLKYWNKPWPHRLKGLETEIISFCDLVSTKFEIAQQYLIRLLKDYNIPHFYEEMVVSHLVLLTRSNEVSPTREGREKKTLLGNIRRNNKPQEQMRYMFDHLDELSSVLQKRYPSLAKIEISNAWVAMMWRGMCWRRCHGPEWEDDLPLSIDLNQSRAYSVDLDSDV